MNRRTLLTRPFRKKNSKHSNPKGGLDRYTGEWGSSEVKHLASRAFFFCDFDQKKNLESIGLQGCLDIMFSNPEELDEPINFSYPEDPNVNIGESWLYKAFTKGDNRQRTHRQRSIDVWAVRNLTQKQLSLKEKMVLFWHNHFVTADLKSANFTFDYLKIFRNNPFGNFKTFAEEMTVNASMLRYLNGRENTVKAPNENYARELLELFTIGKGPLVGPGDYTNYTEHDVAEIAKILTGWIDVGYFARVDGVIPSSIFLKGRHDKTTKKLSNRFGEVEIPNESENEYKTIINIIFEQDEVARFLVRKLYRWFVFYEIDEVVEQTVIEPLAQILRDNAYEVRPVLEVLFASEHFYDIQSKGCLIKSPIDMLVSLLKQFEMDTPVDLLESYNFYFGLSRILRVSEMEYHNPPSVAGWEAYHQEPSFNRIWINAVTLVNRKNILKNHTSKGVKIGDKAYKIDYFSMFGKFSKPKDPVIVVDELCELLLPMDITKKQKDFLLDGLLDGLPASEWGIEYQNYLDNPDDENLRRSLLKKMSGLAYAIITMPEYQLF